MYGLQQATCPAGAGQKEGLSRPHPKLPIFSVRTDFLTLLLNVRNRFNIIRRDFAHGEVLKAT